MMPNLRTASALAAMTSLLATATLAHHSIASFNRDNPVVVEGTVKKFHLANPHAWIFVVVPTEQGATEEWALEGTAGAGLLRAGYTKYTLKPGERVRLLVAPRRDGKPGGEWTRIISVDGKPMQMNRPE